VAQGGQRRGRRRVVRVADLLRLHPRVPVDTARRGASAVPVDSILRREGRTGPRGVVLPSAAGTAHVAPGRPARVAGALLVAGATLGAAAVIAGLEPPGPADPAPVTDPAQPGRERVRVPLAELVPVPAPVEPAPFPAPVEPAPVPAPVEPAPFPAPVEPAPVAAPIAPGPVRPAPDAGRRRVASPGSGGQDPATAVPARTGGAVGPAPGPGPVDDPAAPVVDPVQDTTGTVLRDGRAGDGSSTHRSSPGSSAMARAASKLAGLQSSTSGAGSLPDPDERTSPADG
jgi:hypothetical protein